MKFHITKRDGPGWHVLYVVDGKAAGLQADSLDDVFRMMRYEAACRGFEGTLEQACEKSMRDDPPKQPRHVDGAGLDPKYWLGAKKA